MNEGEYEKKRNINNTGYGTTYNCPADGYGNNPVSYTHLIPVLFSI